MAVTNNERYRLILAIAISPSVPILVFATLNWRSSGSAAWFPILFVLGYLCFFLFGLPVVGILIKKKTLVSSMLGGGCAAVAPVFLLSLLTLFSSGNFLSSENLFGFVLLFVSGCLGGALFWAIAFFNINKPGQGE